MNNKCGKCEKPLPKKQFLTCSVCNISYDIDCGGVEKLFFIMGDEGKRTWKCRFCRGKKQSPNTQMIVSTPIREYVTVRNKNIANIPTSNSFETFANTIPDDLDEDDNDEEFTSLIDDKLSRSCPELSTVRPEDLEELKRIISNLQEKLVSADKEIENLLMENGTLKKKLNENKEKIDQLKRVCGSSTKKLIKKQRTQTKSIRSTYMENISFESINTQIETQQSVEQHSRNLEENRTDPGAKTNEGNSSPTSNPDKNQLYFISSNKRNKILQKIEGSFGDSFNTCHFITQNVGTKELLRDIDEKLKEFTLNDICVLLISENDFKVSNNYTELVAFLRTKLSKISHTNFVICLPTFKCGRSSYNIYNRRIETFNDLLYKDVQSNEYAYLLDSNLHLTYDRAMFSFFNGTINNKGIANIFMHLKNLIMDLMYMNNNLNYVDESECTSNKNFFRA